MCDTPESAFARLAEMQGWLEGSPQYNNQLRALHEAGVRKKMPIATSAPSKDEVILSAGHVEDTKIQHGAARDKVSERPSKCRGSEARTAVGEESLSASESIPAESRIQSEERDSIFRNMSKFSANCVLKTSPPQDIHDIVAGEPAKQKKSQPQAQQAPEAASAATAATVPLASQTPQPPVHLERYATRASPALPITQTAKVIKDPSGAANNDGPTGSPYKLDKVGLASSAGDDSLMKSDQARDSSFDANFAVEDQKIHSAEDIKLEILQSLCRSVAIDPVPDTICECKVVNIS